ncbi:MAG: PPK2 family polyphosphate kinase [Pyrinomonadaceae bacterium]
MSYAHRLIGGQPVSLSDYDPQGDGGLKKDAAAPIFERHIAELQELQELLYASNHLSVLIVLQGRDTSGKDGTIRHIFGPLNSQSCRVASFKVPSHKELAHDFLWRVHAETPARGQITVFNRSHYEDVLVVRVHGLAPEPVWRARYRHINEFERLLAESRTLVLKFYLHISRDEQMERLLKREQDPTKYWKLSAGDWKEREHWDAYTAAYEEALTQCSTDYAPWHVVPANKKWFRNLAIAETIVEALRPYKAQWMSELEETGARALQEIKEFRDKKA